MPKMYVSNKDESVRMFKSDFFESFSHVHPAVPHVIYIPVIAYMLYSSFTNGVAVPGIALLFLGGVFFWSLVEYLVHRFAFHTTPAVELDVRERVSRLKPGEAVFSVLDTFQQKQYFLSHGVHHDYPNDSKRLVMPPMISIPLGLVFYYALTTLFGVGNGSAVFAGQVLGYLIYDTVHFAVHHFQLRSRVTLYLKKKHFRHHYQDSTRDFGVSNPLWDMVMGTMGQAPALRRQATDEIEDEARAMKV